LHQWFADSGVERFARCIIVLDNNLASVTGRISVCAAHLRILDMFNRCVEYHFFVIFKFCVAARCTQSCFGWHADGPHCLHHRFARGRFRTATYVFCVCACGLRCFASNVFEYSSFCFAVLRAAVHHFRLCVRIVIGTALQRYLT